MGQYYNAVVLGEHDDVIAAFIPWSFDNGAKLMEHSYVGNGYVAAVEAFIYKHPGRLVWAGDYADPETGTDANLYHLVPETTDGVYLGDACLAPTGTGTVRYIVNHYRHLYVDLSACPVSTYGMTVHPLPLLVAEGNGRGGGDYYDDNPGIEHVGTWARDVIEATDIEPEGYTEFRPGFTEVS